MGKHKFFKGQKGFTLVEIAIVLVIIGLLIGGVLKGQSMIYNAKVKRLVNDIEGMRTAVLAFQDRHSQMFPGDCNVAVVAADANLGNRNGRIDETSGWEIEDLRLDGLLGGTGITLPSNAYGGTLRVGWAALGTAPNTFNWILVTNIPAEVAQEIDTKYDDGVWNTGSIRASAAYTENTTIATFGSRLESR